MGQRFSLRYGYSEGEGKPIREDAPAGVRYGLTQTLRDLGVDYEQMRKIICPVLNKFPYSGSYPPSIEDEVRGLIERYRWYQIYDIAEAMYRHLSEFGSGMSGLFEKRLNNLFENTGIAWQMVEGRILTRGSEEFEHALLEASAALQAAGYQTPNTELSEARRDLSKRPDPDITGAIQHCIAALECSARELSGQRTKTLGKILQDHANELGIPKPLDSAAEKIWGYASEMGRHLQEGRVPTLKEAELLLGVSTVLISYLLAKKMKTGSKPEGAG